MRIIESVITFVTVFHYSVGQPMFEICRAMSNGNHSRLGYNPHGTDCDKFIQCHYNNHKGVLEGQIQQCSFSTYWNDDKLTCTPASHTDCLTDKCKQQLDGFQYDGDGNCRGYWSCKNGKSVASCCPQGQYYNATLGCTDNDDYHNCTVNCLNDVVVVANNQTVVVNNQTVVMPCRMKVVPGKPTEYQLERLGHGPINMPCAPGTQFVEKECMCKRGNASSVNSKPKCTREVFLSFETDAKDMSGNNNYVSNSNVMIENGAARFDGVDSHLIIQRFNNMEHASTIVIKVNYTSDHTKLGATRAIVSNSGNCTVAPSVLISEDSTNVNFGVDTTNSSFVSTPLRHNNMLTKRTYSQKSVVYKYNGAELSGTDGYNRTAIPLSGYISNVHCPLYVGFANGLAAFEGEIDSLEIYLCDPDKQ